MGVHAIDGMIDLCGAIDQVYCQSFRRVVEIDSDDTTFILFRMKDGMSGDPRNAHRHWTRIQFPGFRIERIGALRRHDACRRSFI